MSDEKGYVQFHCEWDRAAPPAGPLVDELVICRNRLRAMGLLGVYPDGIGFGNVSARLPEGGFLISGTATGHLPTVGPEHFTRVLWWDVATNALRCCGPVAASSESLSHAAIYAADRSAAAVIHVHNLQQWEALRDVLPTTDPRAGPGTPEMADAIAALLARGVPGGVFVMGGHREGLMSFGATVGEALNRLLAVT